MKFGNYHLGQVFSEIKDELKEVSEAEYRVLGRTFSDEKIYKGKDVNFVGSLWTTIVGIADGQIYKIGLQHYSPSSPILSGEDEEALQYAYDLLVQEFGEPNETKDSLFLWDTEWGNICLDQIGKPGTTGAVNLTLTSNQPFKQLAFFEKVESVTKSVLHAFIASLRLRVLVSPFFWSPFEHSDDENLRWSLLRALEWGGWPLFVAQPVAPILFLVFPWWQVAVVILILNWLWALVRYKYISLTLASFGCLFVRLKWFAAIGVGIYFLVEGNYFLAVISALWPIITLIMGLVSPPFQTGKLQGLFMNKLGYGKTNSWDG